MTTDTAHDQTRLDSDGLVGVQLGRAIVVESPLVSATDPAWAASVLADEIALLQDHAHLEAKAAINALTLLGRRARDRDGWALRLTAIAREEVDHLALVQRLLRDRNTAMNDAHASPYAAGLRKAVRRGQGPVDTLDRLLISSLIEARSAERFALLSAEPHPLAEVYADLVLSERGHHRVFVALARHVAEPDAIAERLAELVDVEADLMDTMPAGPGLHSGAAMHRPAPA